MNDAITMPAGDPVALEQLAAQLEAAGHGAAGLGGTTGDVAAQVRSSARWTGDAAEAYTAFTGNLAAGVTRTATPLERIAAAVREYASALRTAQTKVSTYATTVQSAQNSGGDPASLAAADVAGQDAAAAVEAQQAAGNRAAVQVRQAGEDLVDPFGPDGPVRAWIERVHAPWDSLAGDAALGRLLAHAAAGQEEVEEAEKFAEALPELMAGKFDELAGSWMLALHNGQATVADLAGALRDFSSDYQAISALNSARQAAGEAAQAWGRPLAGVAAGFDVLGIAGDVYTEIKPEDAGVMGWVDRGVAGVNGAAAGLDLGYATAGLIMGTTIEIPVVGEVALVGTGLYLGADYLYHHWTPFHDAADDVGHAVASAAKDTWHDVTSFF